MKGFIPLLMKALSVIWFTIGMLIYYLQITIVILIEEKLETTYAILHHTIYIFGCNV